MSTKMCRVCEKIKPNSDFYGSQRRCIDCTKEYNRKYYIANQEELQAKNVEYVTNNKESRAEYHKSYREKNRATLNEKEMVRKFGISTKKYQEILAEQGGGCAVCGRTEQWRRMPLDHNHDCCSGKKSCGECVRGILCDYCNRAMGLLKDDVETLRAMIRYLEN